MIYEIGFFTSLLSALIISNVWVVWDIKRGREIGIAHDCVDTFLLCCIAFFVSFVIAFMWPGVVIGAVFFGIAKAIVRLAPARDRKGNKFWL